MPPAKPATPESYIQALSEPRQGDIRQLQELIVKTVPKLTPCIRYKMLGYGPYHYRYASGREGDAAVIGLASQKQYISLYVCACDEAGYLAEQYRDALPKANIGKSCIRFKRLSDLDLDVVKKLLKHAQKVGGMSQTKQTVNTYRRRRNS